ncbi:Hsp70 family protein [Crossiella sp. CA-258035]|uniref:Hsp70 family protein n=1 Tax=Crossiella sp. CA-258035 TaxID=2981138 RepID=UPI0024BC407E|nr:Hsp70 family protein [Crossiella sp. CA-258035]WHT21301.1 Hsp70 family protein [Crossiella sp. CA-258035]
MRVLSVDLGTSNTVAVLSAHGLPPRVIEVDGSATMPSAVYANEDGTLLVGRDAERQARLDPSRFEPNPKRRIDETTLLLGTDVITVTDALAAVLERVAKETARQLNGVLPDEVRLTHPAQWGSVRRNALISAARLAGLGPNLVLVPEPVAAAAHFASFPDRELSPGQALAVYDLGAGTFDVAVVGVTPTGFTVLAEDGLPDLGGLDVDHALLVHVGREVSFRDPGRWQRLLRPESTADRRARRTLLEDVREAKEALSRHQQTEVPMPEEFSDVLVTRTELEALIRPSLLRSVDVLAKTIQRAGMAPEQLAGIYLVGGSSRIPLVAQLIADRLRVVPASLDQPETAVAKGAHDVPQDDNPLRTQDVAAATAQGAHAADGQAQDGYAQAGQSAAGHGQAGHGAAGQGAAGHGQAAYDQSGQGQGAYDQAAHGLHAAHGQAAQGTQTPPGLYSPQDVHATGGYAPGGHAAGAHATGSHATDGHATGSHATGSHATGSHATGSHVAWGGQSPYAAQSGATPAAGLSNQSQYPGQQQPYGSQQQYPGGYPQGYQQAQQGAGKKKNKTLLIGIAAAVVVVVGVVFGIIALSGSSLPSAQDCQAVGTADDKGFTDCTRQLAGAVADSAKCAKGAGSSNLPAEITKLVGAQASCSLTADGQQVQVIYQHASSQQSADLAAALTKQLAGKGEKVEAQWEGNGLKGRYSAAVNNNTGWVVFTVEGRPLFGVVNLSGKPGSANAMADLFEQKIQPGTTS